MLPVLPKRPNATLFHSTFITRTNYQTQCSHLTREVWGHTTTRSIDLIDLTIDLPFKFLCFTIHIPVHLKPPLPVYQLLVRSLQVMQCDEVSK